LEGNERGKEMRSLGKGELRRKGWRKRREREKVGKGKVRKMTPLLCFMDKSNPD